MNVLSKHKLPNLYIFITVKENKNMVKTIVRELNKDFVHRISKDPLNPNLHLQYAVHAFEKNNHYLALAEFKTAEFLGADNDEIQKYKDTILSLIPPLDILNHNQYFRLKSLASEIKRVRLKDNSSILDVGGGLGQLALFIPEAPYCLAEPTMNGISGIDLPFSDNSFDYVVSCHVLEHIPIDERWLFLDQLLSKSKYGLILLNPFHIDGSNVEERLQLVIDITGAEWAKEHLECSLPRIEDIEEYAKERKLKVTIKPNGTMTTGLALFFTDFFAYKSGKRADLEKVNKFFNMNLDNNVLDSEDFPIGYIVHLSRPEEP